MRIIKHFNPHFPHEKIYKCTIGNSTQFGTYDEVSSWRDERLSNSDYYNKLEELSDKGRASFYTNNHNNWCGD
jgi:hypothetical protein